MTDRELLELAALAAGIAHAGVVDDGATILKNGGRYFDRYWNPLEDDGDCARLETKCEMLVSVDKDCARAGSYINGYGIECSEQYANYGGDRNKARRFASVRCAAEIGRRMKERK